MANKTKSEALLSLANDALAYWAGDDALRPVDGRYYGDGSCCLVTAAFLKGKDPLARAGSASICAEIKARYGLTTADWDVLISAFDGEGESCASEDAPEAAAVGRLVRRAVLGKGGEAVPKAALKALAARGL